MRNLSHLGVTREGRPLNQAMGLCWCLIAGMVCSWGAGAACPSQGLGAAKKGMPTETL